MKRIFTILFSLISIVCFGQAHYNPAQQPGFTFVVNKPFGESFPVALDARSEKADTVNLLYRPYNGTAEVLTYLNTTQSRTGWFPIVVNVGGSLQSNGTFIGGTIFPYWFLRGTADSQLVLMNTPGLTSFNGRTAPAVIPTTGDYTFAQIGSTPTTIAGYGITDAVSLTGVQTLTNKSMSGLTNTFTNIPNSALTNNSIGLTLDNTGSSPSVSGTPAALGTSFGIHVPFANGTNTGFISNTDWTNHNNKVDSTGLAPTLDSVFDYHNGTKNFRYKVPAGTGTVLSVSNADATMVFSPTTGNVLGRVNTASSFAWTGLHSFTAAPSILSLTSNGGVLYTNGAGTIQQATAGTTSQILQGGTTPSFFTPNATTVNTWLGYTPLSNALGSTHIFVGNGSNIATDVALSQDAFVSNIGAWTNTGLLAKSLPGLTTGNLRYNGTNWIFDNTAYTSTLTTLPVIGSSPTLSGNTLNIDTFRYSHQISAADYMPTGRQWGDGQIIYSASAPSSSSTVTSATTVFVPTDVGKIAILYGSGTSGKAQVGTITAYIDASHVSVSFTTAQATGPAQFTWGSDCTSALQTAILIAWRTGEETVDMPIGLCLLAGPLITSDNEGMNPNSQIYFPDTTHAVGLNKMPIRLRGHGCQTNYYNYFGSSSVPQLEGGTILLSTLTSASGTRPGIFGTAQASGATFMINPLYFENFIVEGFTAGGLTSPVLTPFSLYNAAQVSATNVDVRNDVDLSLQSAVPVNVCGWIVGHTGNNGPNIFNNTSVHGYWIAYIPSEHTLFNSAYAIGNVYGVGMQPNYFWVQGNITIHAAFCGIYFPTVSIMGIPTNANANNSVNLTVEYEVDNSGIVSQPWFAHSFHVLDSGSIGHGSIYIQNTLASTGLPANNSLNTNLGSTPKVSVYTPAYFNWNATGLAVGGTPGSPTCDFSVINNQNGYTELLISNNSTGGLALGGLQIGNASNLFQVQLTGTNKSTHPDRAQLFTNASNGMVAWLGAGNFGVLNSSGTELFSIQQGGQGKLDGYTSSSSFPGTATALLGTDASGNMITLPTAGTSYTATLTNTTNITLSSLSAAMYTRVGNVVHVTIYGSLAPTTGTSAFVLTATLPISTTSTPVGSGDGTWWSNGAGVPTSAFQSGIVAPASNTTVTFTVYNATAFNGTEPFSFSFDYVVN